MKTANNSSLVVCRMCGEKKDTKMCLAVFSDFGKKQNLHHKINKITHINVCSEGFLPKQICHPCLNKLDAAYDFYTLVQSVQEKIYDRAVKCAERNDDIFDQNRLDTLEKKCKQLTANSPIYVGESIITLKSGNEIPNISNNSSIETQVVPNQNFVTIRNHLLSQQPSQSLPGCTNISPIIPTQSLLGYSSISPTIPKPCLAIPAADSELPITNQYPGGNCHTSDIICERSFVQKRPRSFDSSNMPKPIEQNIKKNGNLQKLIKCNLCDAFISADNIKHRMLHRRGKRRDTVQCYSCLECNSNFISEQQLKNHSCLKS